MEGIQGTDGYRYSRQYEWSEDCVPGGFSVERGIIIETD